MLEVFISRAVLKNVKDWLLLDGLELGFEVLGTLGVRGRVAAAAGVVLIVDDVLDLSAWESPISLSTAILFGLFGIGVDESRLGKVLVSQMLVFLLLSVDGGVVTVAELVGASHVDGMMSGWREGVGWMKEDNWQDNEAVCVDGGKGGRWIQW